MGSTGLGLLIEEHRNEVVSAWREAVERELGGGDLALAFAVAPLVREMALALGGPPDPQRAHDAWTRCAVLVRSSAPPARLAREFKLLHRCLWEALRARGAPVAQADRRAADEWMDEALAQALDRLERVRLRAASFDRLPEPAPRGGAAARSRGAASTAQGPAEQGWGPAGSAGGAGRHAPSDGRPRPPPLPRRASSTAAAGRADPLPLELEPADRG